MFNFEDKKEERKNISIFNNGVAGVAENVTVTALKKGKDYDGENVPNYKLKYTDGNGSSEMAYYYLEEANHNPQYGTYEEAVEKQWRKLASILTVCGEDSTGKFENAKDMLDTMMSKINKAVKGKEFKVFANYGHNASPRKYIQVRSWTPFIELQETSPSSLKPMNIDQMERLVPDNNSGSNSTNDDDGWS